MSKSLLDFGPVAVGSLANKAPERLSSLVLGLDGTREEPRRLFNSSCFA